MPFQENKILRRLFFMINNINSNMDNYKKKVEEVALYIRVSTEEQALNGDSLRC